MEASNNIDKSSRIYQLIREVLVRPSYKKYYKKIEFVNKDVLDADRPIILCPNHQNALMDAMAIVFNINKPPIFMARADIFKKKIIRRILTFFKMMPIYRIRDGRSSLGKNDDVFSKIASILIRNRNPVCIFPEGNHGDKKRLRPLVKGVFRAAFLAQEKNGDNPFVQLVPVGLDYSHYQKFNQKLFINFGDPIEVSDYWQEYQNAPAVGVNKLKNRLAEEMKKRMIHIETETYYDMYIGVIEVCKTDKSIRKSYMDKSLKSEFDFSKKLIEAFDETLNNDKEKIDSLHSLYSEYSTLKEKLNLRNWVPARNKYSIVLSLLTFLLGIVSLPLLLLGIVTNWVNFFLPTLVSGKIKDKQFHSTFNWALGVIFMWIYYLILIILILLFVPILWLKFVIILLLPEFGLMAYAIRNLFVKTWAKLKYSLNILKGDEKTIRLRELHQKITSNAKKLLESINNHNNQ